MIKKITEIAPAVAMMSAICVFVIGFYASQAVAEHDEAPKSHPVIKASVKVIESNHNLLKQKLILTQVQNTLEHKDIRQDIERIITALQRIEGKIDAL